MGGSAGRTVEPAMMDIFIWVLIGAGLFAGLIALAGGR